MKLKKTYKMNRYLVLVLILLLWFLSFNSVSIVNVKAQPYIDIDVETAHEMINNNTLYPDLIVLDVREQSEYDQGHLCDAILIPLGQLATRISELEPYKDTEIIVYCLSGGRSVTASLFLDDQNFTKVYNMLGGITAWEAAGYEICTDENGKGQVINFPFGIFVLILLSAVSVLLLLYKKRLNRK
ncbi:MAG: rhodanese-like domain-containing protein [Candidatus Hodarchaeota archaeon]